MNREPGLSGRQTTMALAATLSALALSGNLEALTPDEALAASRPACPRAGLLAYCKWVPIRVQDMPGTIEGNWKDCIGVDNRKRHNLNLTCDIANTADHKVTASITGDLNIGIADLSAVVGYDATATTDVTGSISYDISKNVKFATIQYAPEFSRLRRVTQAQERCISERMMKDRCSRTGAYAVAYTEQYQDPIFRLQTHR